MPKVYGKKLNADALNKIVDFLSPTNEREGSAKVPSSDQ
jgi:hypothetical protein